jgi:hypothetical protein
MGAATPLLDAVPDPDARAEMIVINSHRAVPTSGNTSATVVANAVDVVQEAPDWLTQSAPAPGGIPLRTRGHIKIGLRWPKNDPRATRIDLDLYVLPRPGAKELCYYRTRTPEGRLRKDWPDSPCIANGFETVELNGEADLTQLTVAVNFYSGSHSGGGVQATLRLWVDGTVSDIPVRIAAGTGNHGAASAHRLTDRHWAVLTPTQTLAQSP